MSFRAPHKAKCCAGCGKSYTISGYGSHLKQTTRPACIAVRNAEMGLEDLDAPASPSAATPPGSPSSHGDDDDLDAAEDHAIPFEGDHYGAYSAEEFDDFDEYDDDQQGPAEESEEERRQEDTESQDDDEVDAANLEAEAGWEPPPPATIPRAPAEPTTSTESSQDANVNGGYGAPDRAAQSRAHEHLQTKTYSVRFPSNHAGAPIQRGRERSAYEQFQGRIDAVNANPYAPFASRIDWEVARWAKMRGPGSTAVSELLAIEEVSTLAYPSMHTHTHDSD